MRRKMFSSGLTLLKSKMCYWAQGKSLARLFLSLPTLVSLLFVFSTWKPSKSRSKTGPILRQTSTIIKIKFSYWLQGVFREAQTCWGPRICQEGSRAQWPGAESFQCSAIGRTRGKGGIFMGKANGTCLMQERSHLSRCAIHKIKGKAISLPHLLWTWAERDPWGKTRK